MVPELENILAELEEVCIDHVRRYQGRARVEKIGKSFVVVGNDGGTIGDKCNHEADAWVSASLAFFARGME